jgi:anti-anti-sigma factor
MMLRAGRERPLRTHLILCGDTALLMCWGEIDLANVGDWENALGQAGWNSAAEVLVDLWGIHFLDGSALRVLGRAQRALAGDGRRLRVRSGPWIQRLLHLARLECVLEPDPPDDANDWRLPELSSRELPAAFAVEAQHLLDPALDRLQYAVRAAAVAGDSQACLLQADTVAGLLDNLAAYFEERADAASRRHGPSERPLDQVRLAFAARAVPRPRRRVL